ncbi:hypothetical protein Lal_00020652 [Lupinus albus]|uniref:Uncharacterized protein n=1 Tax=Lupinus albus TaxID=3870 RepID=A0A6A5MFD8_LUPAL|nr:hypothetical protein Lalb_Chr08g0239681 [Lupinus albus]KAF1871857.1 hypothetical protein Lal_00020652 [Lupinus albus]
MFMSMFSHFDISQGKMWSFSFGDVLTKDENLKPKMDDPSSSTVAKSKIATKDILNPSSTPTGTKKNKTRLGPRFAPELDGLHCFESIVPC